MGQQRSTEGHVDMHVPTPTRACTTVSSTTHTGTCMTLWASHHTSLLPSCRDMTSTPHQCSRVTGHPTHDTVSYMSTLPHTSPHLHMHAHGTAPQHCSLLPCPCTGSWTHARMQPSTCMHACVYPYADANAPCTCAPTWFLAATNVWTHTCSCMQTHVDMHMDAPHHRPGR